MPVPIGYITYTIYPKNAIFTASYIDINQTDTFSFTNEDCTIVDDHLFYRSGEVNKAGTTTIVAYGVTQTINTADGDSDPIININVPKPSNLYAWTDPNVIGTIYYAWYCEETKDYWYTLSDTPSSGDNVYKYDSTTGTMTLYEYCAVYSYNPDTTEMVVGTLGDKELCQRDSEVDVIINETLYAWTTTDSMAQVAGFPYTFYTKTNNPTTETHIFDNEGNDITATFVHGAAYFSQASTETITWITNDPI